MDKFVQKLIKEIANTLSEIRAGDIMALYATIWGALLIGAVIILAQKNVWAAVILLLLSPIPIFIMTVVTKTLVSKFRKELGDSEATEKPDNKESRAQKEIDIPKSARQMCGLAEEFSSSFRHIRDAFVLENEKESTNVFGMRKEVAREHIKKLIEIFQLTKYYFDCRVELEKNIVRLMGLFGQYTRTLDLYQDMRSQQAMTPPGIPLPYGDLNGFVNTLFGDKATNIFNEVDDIAESVIRMLIPYIRGENIKEKSELRYSRFHRRAIHLEWKVNADAKVVNNYLLQSYSSIVHKIRDEEVFYEVDQIESFDPEMQDTFQYGFIAHGSKITQTHPSIKIGGALDSIDPQIETLSEMFFITISQGEKDVSIVGFDTDIRPLHQFITGLARELRKAFKAEFI